LHGKKPAIPEGTDWKLIPKNPELSRTEIPGNFAVHTENRLVIDVDVKKGAKGKESYKQLCSDLGLAPNWERGTFVVRTGSGGFHVYLNCPDVETVLTLKQYPGLEFRHGPFYVVGAGSIHPDTKQPYEVVFGQLDTLLDAPEALVDAIRVKKVETGGEQPEPGFVDDSDLNTARFIEILQSMPEVPVGNQRNSCYVAACRGRDLGLSKNKCIETLQTYYNGIKLKPPIQPTEVEETAKNAYKYAKDKAGHLNVAAIFKTAQVGDPLDFGEISYDLGAKGTPAKTLNNAVNYIATVPQLATAFRYNAFSGLVEIDSSAPWYKERGGMSRGANLCDEDAILLKYFLTKTMRVEFSAQTIFEAIQVVAHKRHYHPVQNYLNSLSWDGVPRLDTWMIRYGHAIDSSYTRAISRKVLCAAVKRVMQPGCKWDHVLIIEGAQGIGKSTCCRILGRAWAGDMNLDPHNKDSVSMMIGKWVIELSEMVALKWADANALKSFITREKDTVRLPYERHAKDFPRQSIFIGTVNPEHVGYLNDITGNRRYWIIRFSGAVDLVGLEDNCDQLWAEARALYETEKLYLEGEAEILQVQETQARMPEDPMRGNVIQWLKKNPEKENVSVEEVLDYIGIPMKSVTRADQSRIAQTLVEMGWERKRVYEDGVWTSLYVRPLRDRLQSELVRDL
jgi:predicted P-loop ATPase